MQKRNGCPLCVHYLWDVELDAPTCAAFPEGIPDAIYVEGFDHRAEYDGDQGIRFQAESEEDAEQYDLVMNAPRPKQ